LAMVSTINIPAGSRPDWLGAWRRSRGWVPIGRRSTRQPGPSSTPILNHGAFTIWGFAADGLTAQWDPLFTRFKAMGQEDGSAALWGALALLTDAGLIEEVTHLVEGLNAGAQVIYPYALPGTGEPEEREVQGAAHEAALRVIHPERYRQAQERLSAIPYLCPVRSHITGVEMVGVVRPTHRAHTKRTAAWRATFLASCAGHAEFFRLFGQTAAKSVA
ncbi:hypothetical protein MKK68_06275, partial [Methylobacterium sp. E-016]|uniref:hypothetical protein n=1 Tax=Methylobacterium sp. E-016 TaxID=2836556 RepID=UPI001FBA32D1